ncbi:hypothetical protein HPP92_002216 [Vanilla planifolia]|uniref:Uncharacterized protein n=1 Tax=Vanilla planifolia TaxID=51239 RepID=A0A835S174_VANPL|nr:hypothetical protein HPP92_002216 [Vanilla planifolia]
MSGPKTRAASSSATAASEVEEMLRAAEDELLLGLRVGSHTISSSSSSLDSDLTRRFEALKSPCVPPNRKSTTSRSRPSESRRKPLLGTYRDAIDEADLMARFAALKGPIRSDSPLQPAPAADLIKDREDSVVDDESEDGEGEGGVSKKEVDQVMQWAMDSARLDPSISDEDVQEEDDDKLKSSEEEEEKEKKKGMAKRKPAGKWLSLFR